MSKKRIVKSWLYYTFFITISRYLSLIHISLTTRELAAMIRQAGIDFLSLPDEECDPVFGIASGAGHIFGATGGVMEAALRTVYEVATGKQLDPPDFKEVRGVAGIKEAEYDLDGTKVKVAVTSGLNNAAKLLDMVRSGEKDYTFIEVMCCPGGCVNGGGQPHQPGYIRKMCIRDRPWPGQAA